MVCRQDWQECGSASAEQLQDTLRHSRTLPTSCSMFSGGLGEGEKAFLSLVTPLAGSDRPLEPGSFNISGIWGASLPPVAPD